MIFWGNIRLENADVFDGHNSKPDLAFRARL